MDTKYSVLMPLYKNDNPEWLKLAIDSMLNQTIPPSEFVIVVDGPIPDTLKNIVEVYKSQNKELFNIHYFEQNRGLGVTLADGVKLCSNELIARMDADDFSVPERCEKQVKAFKEHPDLDVIGSNVDEFVGDMPDCVPTRCEVEMNTQERELYDMLRQDLLIPLKDGDIDAANAASLTGKLLQMSNGAVYDENGKARVIHDHKLEALEDLIEAANGQPVLVAYWFKHDRERIINHLSKLKIKVRDIKSSTDIKDWNAGNIPVALIHPASAGHGLNIQQGGHILIWFGLTWSLELYQQTNARLWRQGQTHVVTIHHIITKNTVDEDVMAALEQKDMTQEKLISAVRARLEG